MESGSIDDRDDGEYNGVGYVQLSEVVATLNTIFFRSEPQIFF